MAVSLKTALSAYRKAKKTQQRLDRQDRQEQKQRQREKVQTSRRIQKQVGNSKAGRALMGATYGFYTNMAPLSYGRKAEKLGYKAYTPSAAAKEIGDNSRRTASWNKRLESSGSYKLGHTAGNLAATALQFAMARPIIKPLGGKLAQSGVGKAATSAIKSKLLKNAAKGKLTQKVLNRIVQKGGTEVTKHGINRAAGQLSKAMVKNASEDIAGDATVGLYRDLASAKANGVDVKDIKQLAPYLGKQVLWNTAIGAVTNGAGPAISMASKNKKYWKTVAELGADGKTRYRSVYTPSRPIKDVVNKTKGLEVDEVGKELISPKIKRGARQAVKEGADNLDRTTLSRALHNQQFVDDVRRNGIDGLNLDEYAKKNGISRKTAVERAYRQYEKNNPVATQNLDRLRGVTPRPAKAAEEISANLSSTKIGTRAVNRHVRGAFDPTEPTQNVFRRDGRKILHRVTDEDYRKAAQFETNGVDSIVKAREAKIKGVKVAKQTEAKAAAAEATGKANINAYEQAMKNGQPVTPNSGTTGTAPNATTSTAGATTGTATGNTAAPGTAPDPTMGGKRTGTMGGESKAAYTVSHQKGNTQEEIDSINETLTDTGMGKKFTETNKDAVDEATRRIDNDSLETSRASLRRKYDNGEIFTNEDNAEIMIGIERYRQSLYRSCGAVRSR